MDSAQLKQQANDLRKQGDYDAALVIYESLWQEHRADSNEWDAWGYGSCLRKLGRTIDALNLCREVFPGHKDFGPIRNLYAWCIYDSEMKKDDADIQAGEAGFLRAAKAITDLTKQEEYSHYEPTVYKVLKYLDKSDGVYPGEQVLDWTAKLDPGKVSNECRSYADSTGKQRETSSHLEDWYRYRTKALEKTERHQECQSLCEEALETVPKYHGFHYDDDIWFRYRIAKAKAKLGKPDEAIADLSSILERKKDWFIKHDLAELLYETGRPDEALKEAVDASLAFGDIEYKMNLFVLIARILYDRAEQDLGDKHILLAYRIRTAKGWKVPQDMEDAVDDIGLDRSLLPSMEQLQKDLRKFWEESKPKSRGKVSMLNTEKGFGFITGDDGERYHFKFRSFAGNPSRLSDGLAVEFWAEMAFDTKKQQSSPVAVRISEQVF
jgi:tetratricopeptide (TPR) repeat protein